MRRVTLYILLLATVVITITTAAVSAGERPALPDLDSIEPYYAQDIKRNLRFLESRPENSELIMRIAVLLDAAGQEDFSREWKLWLKEKGISQNDLNRLEADARERYNIVLQDNTNQEPYNWLTGPDKQAMIAEAENRMEAAAQEYMRRYQQTREEKYLGMAAERFLWANKSPMALAPLLKLRKLKPSDRELALQIARIYTWQNDFRSAQRHFAIAQRLRHTSGVAAEHAKAAYAANDRETANLLFEQYVRRYPRDTAIKKQYIQFLIADNQREKGLELLRSIPAQKLDAALLLALAQEQLDHGNTAGAIEQANLSLRKAGKYSYADIFQATYFLAFAHGSSQKHDKTRDYASRCLQMLEKNRMRFNVVSLRSYKIGLLGLLARLERITAGDADALSIYQQILQLDPGNFTALVFMGEYWRNQTELEKSLESFNEANRIQPGDNYVLWSLADLYQKTQKPWLARGILEQLSSQKDFSDHTMLAAAWEQTGAWQKLADYYWKNLDELLPTNRDNILNALEKAGQKNKAAYIMVNELIKQPFDTDLEQRLYAIESYAPQIVENYRNQKERLIKNYYALQIASLSADIAEQPENNLIRAQRGDIYSFSGNIKAALKDYLKIIEREPATLMYLNRGAELADWSSNTAIGIKLRQKIHSIEPENATNTLQLASLHYAADDFNSARETLNTFSEEEQNGSWDFFKVAFPVYSRSGEFNQARRIIEGARKHIARFNNEDRKLFEANALSLSRDQGPVIRSDFNFFHDTSDIKRSISNVYARFAVRDHQFAEFSFSDLALSRKNSVQRGFRGQEVNLTLHRVDLHRQISINFPAIIRSNHSPARLYLPGIRFIKMHGLRETGFGFSRLPVKDSPEAILQNLYSDDFEFWHDMELNNDIMLRLNAAHSRNSLGYKSNSAGLSIQKTLNFEPYRAIRYSFLVEDGDSENSDLFYLEDYNQSHQVSWIAQDAIKLGRNRIINLFIEVFAGLSYRNDPVYGFNTSASTRLGKGFHLNAYGGIYNSKRNRFDTTDGYRSWQSGLSIEKRYW